MNPKNQKISDGVKRSWERRRGKLKPLDIEVPKCPTHRRFLYTPDLGGNETGETWVCPIEDCDFFLRPAIYDSAEFQEDLSAIQRGLFGTKDYVSKVSDPITKLTCRYCAFLVNSEEALQAHLDQAHKDVAVIRCDSCKRKIGIDKLTYIAHAQMFHRVKTL